MNTKQKLYTLVVGKIYSLQKHQDIFRSFPAITVSITFDNKVITFGKI